MAAGLKGAKMKVTGNKLGDALARAVGINPASVYRVIIDCKVGEIARVITHGFVKTDEGKIDHLKKVVRHYELKPKDGNDED